MSFVDQINKIVNEFRDKFGYDCEVPFDALSGDVEVIDEFKKIVKKCIEDNIDYTIELYGTIPLPPGSVNDILID